MRVCLYYCTSDRTLLSDFRWSSWYSSLSFTETETRVPPARAKCICSLPLSSTCLATFQSSSGLKCYQVSIQNSKEVLLTNCAAGCVVHALSYIDILSIVNFFALVLFFLFLRSEYLRNMEECIWTTVSQIQVRLLMRIFQLCLSVFAGHFRLQTFLNYEPIVTFIIILVVEIR